MQKLSALLDVQVIAAVADVADIERRNVRCGFAADYFECKFRAGINILRHP